MIKKGTTSIDGIFKGSTEIAEIRKGTDLVYENFKTLTSEGVPPLTLLNCKNTNILGYKVYGNSTQNGTPTPSNPIEVESVGDKTKNLFNKTDATMMLKARVEADGIIYDATIQNYQTAIIKVKPNTKYTINVDVSGYTGSSPVGRNAFYTTYPTIGVTVGTVNSTAFGSTYPRTVTTPADAKYWAIWVNRSTNINQQVLDSLIIVEGEYTSETMPPYEPYGYKIPITISSKNLYNSIQNYSKTSDDRYIGDYNYYSTWKIQLKPNTKYSISCTQVDVTHAMISTSYPVNSSYRTTISLYSSSGWSSSRVVTTDATGCLYIGCSGTVQQLNTIVETAKVMIAESNTLVNYEPYIAPRTTYIYLNEPLRKLGNASDYIDFETQKVVRYINKIEASEITRYFTNGSQYTNGYCRFQFGNIGNNTDFSIAPMSNGALGHTGGIVYDANNVTASTQFSYFYWYLDATAVGLEPVTETTSNSTIGTAIKNYLINNNVNLYYARVTPTQESITLPDILLNKGTNIVSVGTSLTPSNMWIKYKGK